MEIDDLAAAGAVADLPFEVRWPTQRGLALWREGDLDAAKSNLQVALTAARDLGIPHGAFHALHLRACVAFSERDYARARALHREALGLCHEIGFLGGMGSSLCELAIIDLVEGDAEAALVRHERGLACYEEGGYHEQVVAARALWAGAAAS